MTAFFVRFLPLAVVLFGFVPFSRAQSDEEDISAKIPIFDAAATDDLKAREGQKVIVHGETADSEKSQSGTNYVRFKGAEFHLTAFKSDLEPFEQGEPADLYEGKRIVVTGVVSIYRDKPQIKLTSPDQVRVLGAEERFPPEVSKEPGQTAEEPVAPLAATPKEPEVIESGPPRENPPVDWRKSFK